MPIGYLMNVMVMAGCTALALVPPRPRASSPWNVSFFLGYLVNELPFVAFCLLLGSTLLAFGEGDIDSPGAWLAVGLAAVTGAGLAVVAGRGLRARPVLERSLSEGLGTGWRTHVGADVTARLHRRFPYARILVWPFFVGRGSVERAANIRYGDAGKRNLLDVYRHRTHPSACPTLVYLHGGAFRIGSKNHGARSLIYRLASHGWVCISANYRLSPSARFPDHLIDVKKVLAWVRECGHQYGADPSMVFLAGSSAGGHLASLAALTPNDTSFQPGFERADTSVTAAITLQGYYGPLDAAPGSPPSSPMAYAANGAPPFFVAHGDQDTVVLVEDAQRFVARLRCASSSPVIYAELPGAQHGFDFFHSLRFEAVVDAIEAFATWVRSTRVPRHP